MIYMEIIAQCYIVLAITIGFTLTFFSKRFAKLSYMRQLILFSISPFLLIREMFKN